MTPLDRIERRFRKFAIPNVTVYLVFLQTIAFIMAMTQPQPPQFIGRLMLQGDAVLAGEWWRVFSFLIVPPATNIILAFFALYFFYLMGTALEGYWGTFRYNLFLLIGYLASLGAAFLDPARPASNAYLEGSVFLAFAYLYPNYVIYLLLFLPVKVKWLALAAWVMYAWQFIFGPPIDKLLMVASVLNFLLFFGKPLLLRARYGMRHMAEQADTLAARGKAFHTCAACGITDKTHPKMEFRYCPDCAGTPGYCMDHIANHEHRAATRAE